MTKETSFIPCWTLTPQGDQPQAIEKLVSHLQEGLSEQVLLGVTGSGKTFTIANVIAKTNRPALIMAPNKTLAAQLFQEFKSLFPKNHVEYFISYYDYYQPEAYIPSSDTFIAKASTINEDIDKMRHRSTRSLIEHRDTIIVSSVSCIYGLGEPDEYLRSRILIEESQKLGRDEFLSELLKINYFRNDVSLERGKFRVRGDTVDVLPAYEKEKAIRVVFSGKKIEKITIIDALRGTKIENLSSVSLFPASHYVLNRDHIDSICENIRGDLAVELKKFRDAGKIIEAHRLEQRTLYDLEMIRELGYCQGIENYSRYLDGRQKGEPPSTLMDYFPKDYLLIIDESHVTVSQIGGMYRGDRMRKETLVNYGFRLSSALDNRPLNFDEFKGRMGQTIYVSATPGQYELERSGAAIVEQIIRPTGLVDPLIFVKPAKNQIDDLFEEIKVTVSKRSRGLVTTLTKKMAEELTQYLMDKGILCRYLHSDIDSLERVEILRDLRKGVFDVLIGINLLREGLDLPEVELVAILDADKEGFLRSRTSLIQTVGRAARNIQGRVIFYADRVTKSMSECLDETDRRRDKQIQFNKDNNITPLQILKNIPEDMRKLYHLDYGDEFYEEMEESALTDDEKKALKDDNKFEKYIEKLTKKMKENAAQMEFEKAGEFRDRIAYLKNFFLKSQTKETI